MYYCNLAIALLFINATLIFLLMPYIVKWFDKRINKGVPYITRWSISHVLFFFTLGLLCPNHLKEFMLIGAGWEAIERLIGSMDDKEINMWTSEGWKGQVSDLLMNYIGYQLASYFYSVVHI